MTHRSLLIALTLIIAALTGCGDSSRPKDLPKLFPCTIIVTQDGKVLDGASVELIAEDKDSAKYTPLSRTDSEGKAAMSTYGFQGVPQGKYKVTISKNADDDLVYGLNSTGEKEVRSYTTYRLVEPQFSDAETTPHQIEITGKDKNSVITLDAGKAIKVRL